MEKHPNDPQNYTALNQNDEYFYCLTKTKPEFQPFGERRRDIIKKVSRGIQISTNYDSIEKIKENDQSKELLNDKEVLERIGDGILLSIMADYLKKDLSPDSQDDADESDYDDDNQAQTNLGSRLDYIPFGVKQNFSNFLSIEPDFDSKKTIKRLQAIADIADKNIKNNAPQANPKSKSDIFRNKNFKSDLTALNVANNTNLRDVVDLLYSQSSDENGEKHISDVINLVDAAVNESLASFEDPDTYKSIADMFLDSRDTISADLNGARHEIAFQNAFLSQEELACCIDKPEHATPEEDANGVDFNLYVKVFRSRSNYIEIAGQKVANRFKESDIYAVDYPLVTDRDSLQETPGFCFTVKVPVDIKASETKVHELNEQSKFRAAQYNDEVKKIFIHSGFIRSDFNDTNIDIVDESGKQPIEYQKIGLNSADLQSLIESYRNKGKPHEFKRRIERFLRQLEDGINLLYRTEV